MSNSNNVSAEKEGGKETETETERESLRACMPLSCAQAYECVYAYACGGARYMCVKVPEVYVVERKHVCAREIKHQHVDNRTLLGPNNMPRGVASLASLVALEWEVWKSVAIPPRGC